MLLLHVKIKAGREGRQFYFWEREGRVGGGGGAAHTSISCMASYFPSVVDETRRKLVFNFCQCDSSMVSCNVNKALVYVLKRYMSKKLLKNK